MLNLTPPVKILMPASKILMPLCENPLCPFYHKEGRAVLRQGKFCESVEALKLLHCFRLDGLELRGLCGEHEDSGPPWRPHRVQGRDILRHLRGTYGRPRRYPRQRREGQGSGPGVGQGGQPLRFITSVQCPP